MRVAESFAREQLKNKLLCTVFSERFPLLFLFVIAKTLLTDARESHMADVPFVAPRWRQSSGLALHAALEVHERAIRLTEDVDDAGDADDADDAVDADELPVSVIEERRLGFVSLSAVAR